MSKTRDVWWLATFVRDDGTNGSTHVKAKNEQKARERVRRICKLADHIEVRLVRR